MREFENQNEEMFADIHRNHRRSGITKSIGYIVTVDQAQELAQIKAAQSRESDVFSLFLLAAQLFVLVTATVVALA